MIIGEKKKKHTKKIGKKFQRFGINPDTITKNEWDSFSFISKYLNMYKEYTENLHYLIYDIRA